MAEEYDFDRLITGLRGNLPTLQQCGAAADVLEKIARIFPAIKAETVALRARAEAAEFKLAELQILVDKVLSTAQCETLHDMAFGYIEGKIWQSLASKQTQPMPPPQIGIPAVSPLEALRRNVTL